MDTSSTKRRSIVIAGGGIMGASIAWHLARRGAGVTLVEKTAPASGTTRDSFAWINATFSKQPITYFHLNFEGIAAWRRLEREMPTPLAIQWGGSVEWRSSDPEGKQFHRDVLRHQAWGYSARIIEEAELRSLLPGVEPGPIDAASYCDQEGTLDPVAATNALLDEARRFGAAIHHPCEVIGLELEEGRIDTVVTTHGAFTVDVLVVACGNGTPGVAAMAGVKIPLKDSPGALAHSAPQARLLQRVMLGPGSHVKQDASGRIIAGDNFSGGETSADGEHLLMQASRYLSKMETNAERISLGWRVMPQDEFPIVGFVDHCPNLYVVATHSGVTLAALFGEYAAAEILDGTQVELLAPYRLSRFGG
jgi:glycine/D-amino acid oxidase-like deaminating enzyme